jgi:hypothetical protein
MTVSTLDNRLRTLEAQGSTGSSLVPATALGAWLIIAGYSTPSVPGPGNYYQPNRTSGSINLQIIGEACEQDIAREFHRIFDSLANSQVELDTESKEVLYANLWDLYA